jgi:hypothetical protein
MDLAELLDRTLGAGVVVAGDVTLSVAEVELVYLNLRALLASVATLEAQGVAFPTHGGSGVDHGPGRFAGHGAPATRAYEERTTAPVRRPVQARPLTQAARAHEHAPTDETRDDERLERGLAQLVLTVVELLRKLMERQALRRVDAGTLEPERVERLGRAFERLEQQMSELKKQFELGDDDLTLRLGPLPGLESEDAR